LTGTNISGELRNPLYSIPKGTIAAHLSSTTLYFLMIILFGCAGSRTSLMDLEVIVAAVVAWPSKWVVYIGIILSSLGAALNNISNSP
jgi:potassium/chloride transporter 9